MSQIHCEFTYDATRSGPPVCLVTSANVYFGGKLLRSNGVAVATDRLGSVRANASGERMSYLPYGQERTSTADGREKFGTYTRDGAGQDYADQRYYDQMGRFWSPDGSMRNVDLADPTSWNKYSYVNSDPANFNDPTGQDFGMIVSSSICSIMPSFPGCGSGKSGPSGGGGKSAPNEEPGDKEPGVDGPNAVYTAALFSALAALKDPSCAGIFNTNPNLTSQWDPRDVLWDMALNIKQGNSYFGSIDSSRLDLNFAAVTRADPATVVSTGNGGVQAASATIFLQSSTLSDYYFGNQTPSELADTLIHELGHVFNMVSGLGGSKIIQERNPDNSVNWDAEKQNAQTMQNCHPH